MQGPPETRYDRKMLLEQCKNNFDKISMYIDELDNLDGNAGAIVGAIADVCFLRVAKLLANAHSSSRICVRRK
jgi:hypothetical protein